MLKAKAKAKAMPGRLYCQPQARLKPKLCLGGFIFTLNKNNNKTTFVSYLNSPRKGCPRGMKNLCVDSSRPNYIKDDLKKNLFLIPLKFRVNFSFIHYYLFIV